MKKEEVNKKEKTKQGNEKKPDNSHLKWTAIILAILIFLLVFILDYCSRTGNV